MQTVSSNFETKSKAALRKITGKIEIDWDKDGTYTDESDNILHIEYERLIQEPFGGVQLAQFDVQLKNDDDRFTPGNTSSSIVDYLIKDRPGKLSVGFNGEYLQEVAGKSEYPKVLRNQRQMRLHFFDELESIHRHKLSNGGELFVNIRTDRYIWGILDDVYEDFFDVIATCDTDESWSAATQETDNHRGGDGAIKISGLSSSNYSPASALDLSGYASTDRVDFFLFVDTLTGFNDFTLRLETTAGTDYFEVVIDDTDLEQGWNQLSIPIGDFTETGTPNWNSIARVFIQINSSASYIIIDEIRARDAESYPRRYIDTGLQFISAAWWGGNTALYEIKTACEAEGARFYADEMGELHFENRQFYNNNDEYKNSVHEFTFDRTTDFQHPDNVQDIINKIVVVMKPRVVQSTKEVWSYGFTPSIGASETREIWAQLNDPCPTTTDGIVQPVSTTDYTANTSSDGTGTDKTAQIDITITRFVDAVKLEVTNNDASPVYLTFLRLRGTPAEEQPAVTVERVDNTSIGKYGESPAGGLKIENKYLANETYAETLADQLLDWYADHLTRIVLTARAVPQLQVGDMITVVNEDTGTNFIMRITHIKTKLSVETGFTQDIHCRSVTPVELLTYFEIGTSEIGGTDVIAA